MARVTLDTVNKIYESRLGAVHAVEDLSLDIADGEFVALLGPSGCGKTSTLRMIVGLEPITSGTIAFNGQSVNDLGPEKRNVAMAFESYALYPNFTVAENLAFPLEVRGVPKAERARKVQEIARLLRIERLLDSRPAGLSGGQQQRVSLGRALIRDPAVFILDEVMSHLDAHLKLQMLYEFKHLHQQIGGTMVYVTHDQMEALALADRVAVMSNARLQQFADRNALYNRPVNTFVADFVGEPPTNFLTAEVQALDGAEPRLAVPGSDLIFVPDARRASALRRLGLREVTIGLRPQNLDTVPAPGHQAVTGTITINEYLGEQSSFTLRNGEAEFRALVPPSLDHTEGDLVTLSYAPGDVMLFHPETEALIE